MKMATLTYSGLEELSQLVMHGFIFEVTKSSDGHPVVLAYKPGDRSGLSRMFLVDVTEVKEEEG